MPLFKNPWQRGGSQPTPKPAPNLNKPLPLTPAEQAQINVQAYIAKQQQAALLKEANKPRAAWRP